jgi:hypothetical protein
MPDSELTVADLESLRVSGTADLLPLSKDPGRWELFEQDLTVLHDRGTAARAWRFDPDEISKTQRVCLP